ncbi:glycosyl hydrolase family 28 protein [Chitinophaga sp. MM2321]|uniref:glycoside hydrolase family 28 protein n=1 Tax=Chitinophaga sp. MM2321 TaxID=3137178 RepID=UPI0032D5B0DF
MKKMFLFLFCCLFVASSIQSQTNALLIVNVPANEGGLVTAKIQQSIDSCAAAGGGVVRFLKGRYLTGALQLKSNVTLRLEKGSVLQGSNNYLDYGKGEWSNSLISGDNLVNIRIEGEGLIDGSDCFNPKGENSFRGPHGIRLTNCSNIVIQGITIINAANWTINCRNCSDATIKQVSIRGGYDGLHTRFCKNFTVSGCDFRTGDDAFAGNDNIDFLVYDCKINTSSNAFRFGCLNFTVKNCSIWGPGEYPHRVSQRTEMLAAFVHFSPKDDHSKQPSGNWLIKDVTINHGDCLYYYNYENGLWQNGQPVTNIVFENIKATEMLRSFSINGDQNKSLRMTIRNANFSFREGAKNYELIFEGNRKTVSSAFFHVMNFDSLALRNVTFEHYFKSPVLHLVAGNSVRLDSINYFPDVISQPVKLENVVTSFSN